MSFGYGVGDFLAVLSLTRKLYKAFKEAPGEFLEISRELQSFHIIIADLEEQAADGNSHLNQYAAAKRPELIAIRDNLISTMKELEDLHERYRQMGRISWSRFKLGQENLTSMRSKLVIQISAVNTFIASLSMGTLGRMEPMLQKIFALLNERVRMDSAMAQTVLSVATEDGSDGTSWAMLELNLRSEGIAPEYIQENHEIIREMLGSVVELNLLAGSSEDTIVPDDSLSQVGRVPTSDIETTSKKHLISKSKTKASWILRLGEAKQWKASTPAPYKEWVRTLSPIQDAARIRLMNHGFNLHELERQLRTRDKLSLFKKSPSQNPSQSQSWKAVCWAVTGGEQVALELLLERGHDPYAERDGITAPLLAVEDGQWELVKLLLSFGHRRTLPDKVQAVIHTASAANRCDVIELLLDRGVDIDFMLQPSKESPLHKAVESGSFKAVEFLLKRGAKVDGMTFLGFTPLALTLAVEQETCVGIFRLLLQYGADPNGRHHGGKFAGWPLLNVLAWDADWKNKLHNHTAEFRIERKRKIDMANLLFKTSLNIEAKEPDGRTSLHLAAASSFQHLVEILLKKGANCFAEDETKRSPLHYAAQYSDEHLVQCLLSKASNANALNASRATPLHLAAMYSNERIVECLVKNGAEANAKDNHRDTPLHLAAIHSNERIVEYLLKNGVKVNTKNNKGSTPLHQAVNSSNPKIAIIKSLLESGAEVNAKDNTGSTPLHWAVNSSTPEIAIIKSLLENGAEVNAKDNTGNTPLQWAVNSSTPKIAIIKILLENGAEVNAKNNTGNTPLHWAVNSWNPEIAIIKILLENGAEVNAKGNTGNTPLHWAVKSLTSEIAIIKTLLENGAEVNAKDNNGNTPIYCAKTGDIAKILIDNGANINDISSLYRNRIKEVLATG